MEKAMMLAQRTESGEGNRISLHGEIDLSNIDAVSRELARLVSEIRCDRIIIDLAAVDYIDSQGVGLLLKLSQRLEPRGISLRLLAPAGTAAGELLSSSTLGELPIDRNLR
jgi:anti-anti-sigma factor